MAVSKVAYGGVTLIDLTNDTAVESDVASGKYFHKADGTRVQGTASGGVTPSGTKDINTNGTHDVAAYAYANVSVPASAVDSGSKNISSNGTHSVVGYANAVVSVPASAVDTGTKNISSNGAHSVVGYANVDVAVPAVLQQNINLSIKISDDDTGSEEENSYLLYYMGPDTEHPERVVWKQTSVLADGAAHTITFAVAGADLRLRCGFYVAAFDGASTSDVTSATGCTARFVTNNGETGSECIYFSIENTTCNATLVY